MRSYALFTSCMSGVSTGLRAESSGAVRLISLGDLTREGSTMQRSRFVFLAAPVPVADGPAADGVLWMLVSPNNRPLGRGTAYHDTYAGCREAVLALRADCAHVKPV
jgi:hypothetical protein